MAEKTRSRGKSRTHHDHDHARPNPHAPIVVHEPAPEYLHLEQAIRELLIAKGVIAADELRRQIELMDARGPALGALLVARAWVDPKFKALLRSDCRAASKEMGIDTAGMPEVMVLENTPRLHHLVVCTLCSCYPKSILGIPPAWYKSTAYRARGVKDPRGVLKEFGTELPADVEVRVMDSTADLRYLVMPMRPAGTEHMSEADLVRLVTRDSMIGVSAALPPGRAAAAAE